MEINLTVEQEAQLSLIAALEGRDADELAREVFLRGLQVEATLIASRSRNTHGQEAAARMLELRQNNMLPDGVTIQDLIREGRA
jgi:ribosomal protein L12E/L44/L45/RPP1/RPP2